MIYKRRDISSELNNNIMQLYINGVSLNDIEKFTGVSKNTLLYVLNPRKFNLKREEIPTFKTEGEKILVIADTHIGSHWENLNYIDEAYETGIKENVSSCIHLGDIIQGSFNKGLDKPISYQLKTLEKVYPEVEEFETYLLMGNHDYVVFEYDKDAKILLESKKGLHPLGYKRAYFNWNNYLFGMDHKIKQIEDDYVIRDAGLCFIGHGHELKIKSQDKLKAPTLSDNIINKESGAYPAFLIAEMYDNEVFVDVYNFKNNKAKVRKRNYFRRKLLEVNKVK